MGAEWLTRCGRCRVIVSAENLAEFAGADPIGNVRVLEHAAQFGRRHPNFTRGLNHDEWN